MSEQAVKTVEERLKRLGYNSVGNADGVVDVNTKTAVTRALRDLCKALKIEPIPAQYTKEFGADIVNRIQKEYAKLTVKNALQAYADGKDYKALGDSLSDKAAERIPSDEPETEESRKIDQLHSWGNFSHENLGKMLKIKGFSDVLLNREHMKEVIEVMKDPKKFIAEMDAAEPFLNAPVAPAAPKKADPAKPAAPSTKTTEPQKEKPKPAKTAETNTETPPPNPDEDEPVEGGSQTTTTPPKQEGPRKFEVMGNAPPLTATHQADIVAIFDFYGEKNKPLSDALSLMTRLLFARLSPGQLAPALSGKVTDFNGQPISEATEKTIKALLDGYKHNPDGAKELLKKGIDRVLKLPFGGVYHRYGLEFAAGQVIEGAFADAKDPKSDTAAIAKKYAERLIAINAIGHLTEEQAPEKIAEIKKAMNAAIKANPADKDKAKKETAAALERITGLPFTHDFYAKAFGKKYDDLFDKVFAANDKDRDAAMSGFMGHIGGTLAEMFGDNSMKYEPKPFDPRNATGFTVSPKSEIEFGKDYCKYVADLMGRRISKPGEPIIYKDGENTMVALVDSASGEMVIHKLDVKAYEKLIADCTAYSEAHKNENYWVKCGEMQRTFLADLKNAGFKAIADHQRIVVGTSPARDHVTLDMLDSERLPHLIDYIVRAQPLAETAARIDAREGRLVEQHKEDQAFLAKQKLEEEERRRRELSGANAGIIPPSDAPFGRDQYGRALPPSTPQAAAAYAESQRKLAAQVEEPCTKQRRGKLSTFFRGFGGRTPPCNNYVEKKPCKAQGDKPLKPPKESAPPVEKKRVTAPCDVSGPDGSGIGPCGTDTKRQPQPVQGLDDDFSALKGKTLETKTGGVPCNVFDDNAKSMTGPCGTDADKTSGPKNDGLSDYFLIPPKPPGTRSIPVS